MDPDAAKTVAVGGLVTSGLGGGYGLIYSIWQSQPWMSLAGRSAVNSGIVGWSFFGIREIFISPFLTSTLSWREYQRRRISYGLSPLPNDKPIEESPETTWKDLRMNRLLDTFLAGGMTGSVLNTIRRGPAVIGPSFLTAGLICSLAQYGANELAVQRLKHFARSEVAAITHLDIPKGPNFRERLEKWQHTAEGFWKSLVPRKLSDEEYAEKIAAHERVLKERQAAKERKEADRKTAKESST